MNKISWLFLALFIAAGVFAAVVWAKSEALTRDQQSLEAKVGSLESDLREAKSAAEAAAKESNFSRDNKLELMRLRSEVSQLRANAQDATSLETELAQLRTQNQELQTVANTAAAGNPASAQRFTRDQWAYSGNGTPEAALLSGLAAAVNSPNLSLEEATGVRILERDEVSASELQMKVYLEGTGELRTVMLKRDPAGWQMTGLSAQFLDSFDPMSFYQKNPELMRRYFPHLINGDEAAAEAVKERYGIPAEASGNANQNQ